MSQEINNPYLASKQLWNDVYGAVEDKLKSSQRLNWVLCGLLVISILSLVVIANKSRIQPYVTVLHGNEVLTLTQFDKPALKQLKPKLAILLARQFIEKVRQVSADAGMNRAAYIQALAMTTDAATGIVKDYYQHKPHNLTNIQITSIMLQSSSVVDLRWLETERDIKTGDKLSSQHYSAEITFRFAAPSTNSIIALHNPLGFYITHIAWSQDYAA